MMSQHGTMLIFITMRLIVSFIIAVVAFYERTRINSNQLKRTAIVQMEWRSVLATQLYSQIGEAHFVEVRSRSISNAYSLRLHNVD